MDNPATDNPATSTLDHDIMDFGTETLFRSSVCDVMLWILCFDLGQEIDAIVRYILLSSSIDSINIYCPAGIVWESRGELWWALGELWWALWVGTQGFRNEKKRIYASFEPKHGDKI